MLIAFSHTKQHCGFLLKTRYIHISNSAIPNKDKNQLNCALSNLHTNSVLKTWLELTKVTKYDRSYWTNSVSSYSQV